MMGEDKGIREWILDDLVPLGYLVIPLDELDLTIAVARLGRALMKARGLLTEKG